MSKQIRYFSIPFVLLVALDQAIKYAMIYVAQPQSLHDFVMIADNPVISIALVFNTGVAFSFLTWLGEWLKYMQVGFIAIIIGILFIQKHLFKDHYIAFSFMFAGGASNVLDRFLHGGVVDYIYWHYKFEFPIFNFADIIINCGVALFILQTLFLNKRKKI
ncbi:signal peptidase II [Helicobacter trogontum]|uniref:signal peptidase II n=1 Tax=Helicobacter trogontum TaxID=50960 RepID=UPI000CF0FD77|nr:signal peptidase II [Helicobacter trogontum]